MNIVLYFKQSHMKDTWLDAIGKTETVRYPTICSLIYKNINQMCTVYIIREN